MKGFILLLSFMTRLYVPKVEYNEEKLGKAMKFFPFVGLIIGLFLYFAALISLKLTKSIEITVVLLLLVEIILTGGIHLDGLSDTFDGIFSYRSKQKMLEIMKDSRVGVNGVLSLIMYFLLKFVLLQTIAFHLGVIYMFYAVFSSPIIARLCSVVSCASAPYARASGMGKAFVDNTNLLSVAFAFVSTFILIQLPFFSILKEVYYPFVALTLAGILLIMSIVAFLFSKLMTRKIGGITGDTLGALLELSQLLSLLILVIVKNLE